MTDIIQKVLILFNLTAGHERSIKAKKNILASFLIKSLSILIGLLLVPLTIDYLNPIKYGIWITLSSIVGWFGFFDIGLGNGLRNKFGEAIANNDHELAKTYVSTTYATVVLIVLLILSLFFFVNTFIPWATLLNAPIEMENELNSLAIIIFTLFCIRLIFQLLNVILLADQRPANSLLLNLFSNGMVLIFIYLITKVSSESIIILGFAFSFTPIIVLGFASLWYFSKRYKRYIPSIRFVKFKYLKVLAGLGVKFFIIQIAVIVLYQSSTIIIAQLFGPSLVTTYNIAFKYFTVISMVFSIIMTPFWSAFTEAYTIGDFDWIKKIMKKLNRIWILTILFTLFMLIVSNPIYKLWIGDKIVISFNLSLILALFVVINAFNSIYSQFLNGVGIISLQLYSAIWGSIINIPLSFFLGKTIGVEGVVLSSCILGAINMIWGRIQYNKIIKKEAYGVWAK